MMAKPKKTIPAKLSDERIVIYDKDGISRLNEKRYGELHENFLSLSYVEALYLVAKDWVLIRDKKNKILSFEELHEIAHVIDKKLCIRYLVYKDLRNRGYTVRTGLKYGSDFRLYERSNIDEVHSKYLVKVFSEEIPCEISEITGFVRVAHSVRKELVIAIVDADGSVVYYNMGYLKL
ncbi:tRNA intron endonuclease [Methanococcus vannielii SB]|uniref:tRNA-splicing endonuclease n=1 Tax=Methanococcus vannielii (strain ATCC 35089 / DSM 1224 / JCM 13029 / OCM 148 / SB) TaxID=406327 RepID=ENDA_METVS|nr:tRNA-intron lyase [Methanococcus vannielii]A6UPD9.1 RecName: Full=tRNA-splicing endonuclease; AltName: Full=tRNA-intron endonuclease [Methanococcus vannielii SB]ABR54361.1 tRNA intron endonuclease [Methanococcus vannielii SB]